MPNKIKTLLGDDEIPAGETPGEPRPKTDSEQGFPGLGGPGSTAEIKPSEEEIFVVPVAERESFAETARKSGLAWSAGIVFFAAIAFMLILGWGADLLLGSSPWGVVCGVIFGSLIGFIQFFRLTSEIFKK